MNILSLIGRESPMFSKDIDEQQLKLKSNIENGSFLVLGGAGSIGQAVTKEIFKRNPKKLHVIDISENNLVELVRDLRSEFGYITGDFQTFALDIGSLEYDAFIKEDGAYDYVLNLSALKHVRSEKDKFTLMRMIDTNITNTVKTIRQSIGKGTKKYFCVSTDKAANPVNLMGASKRIMEMFLYREGNNISISTARFANVAFSDGSLLHGFNQRLQKRQPIVAPNDVKRYFVTPAESGELCLMSCIFGDNGDIFFPKLSQELHLITFSEIAENYLKQHGFEVALCENEDDARAWFEKNPFNSTQWPCLFTKSDTTGEKDFEEFYTKNEVLNLETFHNIGIVKNSHMPDELLLNRFEQRIDSMKNESFWHKDEIVSLFRSLIPELDYEDKGKYLDSKM